MNTAQIIVLVVFALVGIGAIVATVTSKNYSLFLGKVSPVLTCLYTCVSAIGKITPESAVVQTIITVCKTAIMATTYAEEMWIQDTISKEERSTAAAEYFQRALDEAEIEITPTLDSIISGIIALTCYLLPHHS